MAVQREQFGSRIGFILAAAGSAVGIGNLVGFPVKAAQNGGGAFLLVYALFILFICSFRCNNYIVDSTPSPLQMRHVIDITTPNTHEQITSDIL